MNFKNIAATLALVIAAQSAVAEAPKREFRSVWMAAMGIDWPLTRGTTAKSQEAAKKELITYLDNYKQHNFNGVCIHMRPMADALYKSSLEPWSVSVSGTRGVDPGWDPLAFAVEECHKRGLECYAWINPFRIDNNDLTHNTPFDKEWREKGWTMYENKWTVFNPAVPEARKHCMDVMEEIWTNYQIDGMLFDDYFYPGNGMSKGTAAADYEHYKASGTTMSIEDWRRNNVNTFVKELYDRIQAQRPDMRFGIGPAGVGGASAAKYGLPKPNVKSGDWMYNDIFCDPLAWLNDGSIDFIAPQIYWSTTNSSAPFGPLCEWWTMVANHFGRHNYISMASYQVDNFGGNNETGWSEFAKQIDLCRDEPAFNAPGQIYYSAKYFDGPTRKGLGQYLEENSYTAPALVPIVDWKDRVNYAAPANLKYSDSQLTWDATKVEGRAIMRYTVYAVPLSVRPDQATSFDGDGIDGQFLLGVTYDPSYTIPDNMREGYWYATCVYDGYGYESEPAVVNYEGKFSQTPEPTAPADGATVAWDTKFSWVGASNATFRIQIASDGAFRHIAFEQSDLTKPEVTVDLGSLEESATYYWRVFASEPECLTSMSDAFTFVTPARPTAAVVTLQSPADGVTISTPEIKFQWTPVASVDTYTLEIAAGDDFEAPVFTRTVDASLASITIPTASLPVGKYSWHVVAAGSRVHPSTSEVATFEVNELAFGSYEPDYQIAVDDQTYADFDGLTIRNLWTRTTGNDRMEFEADGALNRTMVAVPGRIYISGRDEASASSRTYLREYNAATGEHMRDIPLSDEASVGYLPCNGVIKDSQNNICIHNMSLNTAETPIVIHEVNTATGQVTEIARLTTPEADKGRVDHVAISGDIHSDRFVVFAAMSGSNKVVCWVLRPETTTTCSVKEMPSVYPAAESFGIAPHVLPVNERTLYVDGGNTYPAYYNFSSLKTSGTFETSADAAPTHKDVNGMARFKMDGKEFFAYSSESHATCVKFNVAKMSSKDNMKDMQLAWTLPAAGLGKVNSTTGSAPVDAIVDETGTNACIYVYSPGNGLAAYEVSVGKGAADRFYDMAENAMHIDGLNVWFDRNRAHLAVYTITGAVVEVLADADCVTLPCAGTYIIATDAGNHLVNVK